MIDTTKAVISIHALREEGDGNRPRHTAGHSDFYPRPPRGGRRVVDEATKDMTEISIHALREEGDGCIGRLPHRHNHFYPRPPRGGRRNHGDDAAALRDFYPRPPRGGRRDFLEVPEGGELFLSTPSARRATRRSCSGLRCSRNFYPRPPRGGRPSWRPSRPPQMDFYPRPPRGGRPGCCTSSSSPTDFYPRPPRGGRPCGAGATLLAFLFLSTPSARRATLTLRKQIDEDKISIHALREEGDPRRASTPAPPTYFYPRPPRGGRLITSVMG